MRWTKPEIVKKLRELRKLGKSVSYAGLADKQQPLLSAAVYHFGSYRKALDRAGIDYGQIVQRPRWTRTRIIEIIKKARRKGEDLHWSAVTTRGDELSRAAFASLQPRLFGSWVRTLAAAGLDVEEIARYRSWDRNSIVHELRSKAQDGGALSSGSLQKGDPGLHAAAIRYFGGYDAALRAAKIDPLKHRLRRRWTRQEVIDALRKAKKDGVHLSDTHVRQLNSMLYGACVRLFGCFTAARKAAGLQIETWRRVPKAKRS